MNIIFDQTPKQNKQSNKCHNQSNTTDNHNEKSENENERVATVLGKDDVNK